MERNVSYKNSHVLLLFMNQRNNDYASEHFPSFDYEDEKVIVSIKINDIEKAFWNENKYFQNKRDQRHVTWQF